MSTGLRPVSGTAVQVLSLLRDWEVAGDPRPLVISTSGSTGRPKRVLLSRAAMRASARGTAARLGPGRWVLNLPPTYVAGVQVLFRSVLGGTEPLVSGDLVGAARDLQGERCHVSLVPTQLVRALEDPATTAALATFATVLVGGGPLRPEQRRRAELSGIPVVQTYGMSETCGGCVYDGVPLDGVSVRVEANGEVLLAGPVLFDGYDGEPGRTAAVLREGWLRTDDLGRIDDEGRLVVTGRADDVVISGGVKVPTGAVEAALAAHPGVRDVAVVGVPDPEWGERVVAVVVLSGAGPGLDDLRLLVAERAWAPRQLVVAPSLPLLAGGKVDKVAVRRLARDG